MPLLSVALPVHPAPVPLLRHADAPHPERGVARGELIRVRHGVYASTVLWREAAPWDRYLARVHAVALSHPDAVFCMESAAALLGMPIFGDPVVVHALVTGNEASRFSAGIRTHRSSEDRTIIEVGGLAMTSLHDTAVDLARLRHEAIGMAMSDAALRLDPQGTRDLLLGMNETRISSRGRNVARWSLARSTSQAETAIESVSRAVIEWLGFPAPELQVAFRASSGEEDRADFVWRAADLVGEADGDLKYDGRYGDARTVLRRQSLRDTRLRMRVRDVARWGWRDVTTFAPLRGILAGAGLQPIAPEQSVKLHRLKVLLAPRATHPLA
ncbi:hypothetical protein Q9R08_20695 [Microbacterium sp. QXD-8]|uniref:Transcriptional regulator, AbiEi antitoxin, Type IV TA system n=1 Tax=Microbacterium psychrotolerans TaxID=3068321 RepID=A0ABU0Z737_9MICO|nr:hypothetical protein [Microbacterium sp. QXD-8]MDQ7880418.1 hypothetical protein [Microbacterium sp. QXD-8]